MNKQNITEDAFRFIKYRCEHCGKIHKFNKNFCSPNCKTLYFEKININKIETWTNKKTQSKHRVYKLSDILNKDVLKQMVEEAERNIDKKINILKR